MNHFLAGIVRRGAGMPSPVTLRPAIGPMNIPLGAPSAADAPVEAVPSSRSDARPDAPLLTQPRESRQMDSRRNTEDRALPEPVTHVESRSQSPVEPASQPPVFSTRPAIVNAVEPDRVIPPVLKPAPERSEVSASPRPASIPQSAPPAAPVATVLHPAPASIVQEVLVKPELKAAPTPGIHREKAAVPPAGRTSAESRNIQVKIGKIEIRSTQPAPVVPASRPAAKGGFDDLSLARNYLDRGR
jgi:hypothetical protein